MPTSSPGLDFQTAALAAGVVSGLTFMIGQARSYLDRAVSDAQDTAKQEDAALQRARKENDIYLTGNITLVRYASAPSLTKLLVQTTQSLFHRPISSEGKAARLERILHQDYRRRSVLIAPPLANFLKESKRWRAQPLNEPAGIAISLVILLAAVLFALSLLGILVALLISTGWKHLSAHSSITGAALVLIIAFSGLLGLISWLTAREALFRLIVTSDAESIKLARMVDSATQKWGEFRLFAKIGETDRASQAQRDAEEVCNEALMIHPLIGQALHIQGALHAVEAAVNKRAGLHEQQPILKGVASLGKLPTYLVPLARIDIPDPRLILAWLLQESGDGPAAVQALASFLLSGRPYSSDISEIFFGRLWLDAYKQIEEEKPELISMNIFLTCEKHLREDPRSWAEMAGRFAAQGDISRSVVLIASENFQLELPENEPVRDLLSRISGH